MTVRRRFISGNQIKTASSKSHQGRWLAKLACWIGQRTGQPINILEIGTAAGISGAYLLAGMSESLGGHLLTFEGSPEIAEIAQNNMQALIKDNQFSTVTFRIVIGPFDQTLNEYFQSAQDIIHLVFVDGNHRKDATIEYHNKVRQRMHNQGVIMHDDIAWSTGMIDAWRHIQHQEGVGRTVEFYLGGRPSRGIVFLDADPTGPCEIVHLDSTLERVARVMARKLARRK